MSDNLPFPEETNQGLALPDGNISKKKLASIAKAYVTKAIDEGEEDIADIYIKAKAAEELMKAVQKESKEKAIDEVSATGKEGYKSFGVPAEIASVAAKYTYDHDIGWQDRKKKLDAAKEELDDYQEAMKKAMKYKDVAIEGVIVEPAKASGGGETIKVTIPKK